MERDTSDIHTHTHTHTHTHMCTHTHKYTHTSHSIRERSVKKFKWSCVVGRRLPPTKSILIPGICDYGKVN